jgi:uncharacterized protein
MKIALNIIGSIAVVLAILGIFLPLLPTTPFLLLASACYMRGSQRMHRWLLANRVFGEYLRNFEDKKGMPRKAKLMTLALLWVSMAFSIYTVDPLLVKGILFSIGIGVTVLILRLKTLESIVRDGDAM